MTRTPMVHTPTGHCVLPRNLGTKSYLRYPVLLSIRQLKLFALFYEVIPRDFWVMLPRHLPAALKGDTLRRGGSRDDKSLDDKQ